MLTLEGREVSVTSPSKPYFSRETKLTKLEIVRYYLSVAPGALQGIRDRPIVLKRFVDGAEKEPFYQKRAPEPRPPWLRTTTLSFPIGADGGRNRGGRRGRARLDRQPRVPRAPPPTR